MTASFVKIAVYVPVSNAAEMRRVLAESGAGHIGNYDCCSFSVKGIGRYRGGQGSKPFIGEVGRIEQVEEERIETICLVTKLDEIMRAVKKAHPYEEPAIDIYPLLNEN